MSSLAKQMLKNKKQRVTEDDLGLPLEDEHGCKVIDRPDYFVARALLLERKNPRYDPDSTLRLHLREGIIYQGNKEIVECAANFYRLVGVTYKVSNVIQLLFWDVMRRRLPSLCTDVIKIADGLWWDKKNGEVIKGDSNEIRKLVNKKGY